MDAVEIADGDRCATGAAGTGAVASRMFTCDPAQGVHVTDDRDAGSGGRDQRGEALATDAVDFFAMDALADEQSGNSVESGARHVGRHAVADGEDLIGCKFRPRTSRAWSSAAR